MKDLPLVAVIGAGSSGIAVCKNFKQQGIPFECFEASDRIGGMWVFKNKIAFNGKSSAYRTLHINTSRRQMEYLDFPMPEDYPDFPSHEQVARYFDSYVDQFGFRDHIRFNTTVTHCARQPDGTWEVTLDNGETRLFDALVVANGHHWDPRWPNPAFAGHFDGIQMHSHYYVDPGEPHDFRGKNVVIVGLGNSAMDIACDLGKGVAKQVFLSGRTGVYVVPKYWLGKLPFDFMLRHPSEPPSLLERAIWRMPDWVYNKVAYPATTLFLNLLVGHPTKYGLPQPQGWFGQQHPTVSAEIHIRLGSGDVIPKPNIKELQGDKVLFEDGSVEPVDAIIYCTGYNIRFPFFDDTLIAVEDNDIALYQRIMDPRYSNLFFVGLVQQLCAMMPIADEQSKWIVEYLTGHYHPPHPDVMHERMLDEHERTKRQFISSPRHTIQINCQKYTFDLLEDLREGRKRALLAGNSLPILPRAVRQAAQPV